VLAFTGRLDSRERSDTEIHASIGGGGRLEPIDREGENDPKVPVLQGAVEHIDPADRFSTLSKPPPTTVLVALVGSPPSGPLPTATEASGLMAIESAEKPGPVTPSATLLLIVLVVFGR